MDKLVEILFGYIEIIVMGAMTLALVAFLLAVYHPIRSYLVDYAGNLATFWLKGFVASRVAEWFKIAFAIGLLYYGGGFHNSCLLLVPRTCSFGHSGTYF